ncbi:MAG: hypothetical protein HYS41_01105 [Candidatus Omnitrophica bacterium]|nr:hypothetical protein [Candidatus Omnitrophota bacterium]
MPTILVMRRLPFLKTLLIVSLGAFLLLGIASALPHSHLAGSGSAPHDCWACRAQSAFPSVAPEILAPVPLQLLEGSSVRKIPLLVSQDAASLFDSRAPPA